MPMETIDTTQFTVRIEPVLIAVVITVTLLSTTTDADSDTSHRQPASVASTAQPEEIVAEPPPVRRTRPPSATPVMVE